MDVYINSLASFLPNNPVTNDEIENVLGTINDIPSRTRRRILNNNKIKTRYYAIDPESGQFTHTNAQLTAEAVKNLSAAGGFSLENVECLCCGTSSPDLLMPGHGVMVAGELALPPCDVVTTSGICIAGITALKHACMNVATGSTKNGIATGSELASSFMRAGFFHVDGDPEADIKKKPILAFDTDFLRWMLSDGAGAAWISHHKNREGLSLRVEWIEHRSYAGELDTCMYAGGLKLDNGRIRGWREMENSMEAAGLNCLAVKQDVRLLDAHIVTTAMDRTLTAVARKYRLKPEQIDWYLPHYSSHFFRDRFYEGMKRAGFEIPYEKWFTNLYQVGNIGSASIYLILEALFYSDKVKDGDTILCFIPESGRFAHSFMLLTAVY